MISHRRVQKGKRRIIAYGLVTRYGPRTSCQRKKLKKNVRIINKSVNEISCRKSHLFNPVIPQIIQCALIERAIQAGARAHTHTHTVTQFFYN